MNNISISKKQYKGWRNCIEVTNGIIDLVATADVGPRIIRFGFSGNVNEFCEVPEQLGTTGGGEWKIYGGHRLWHSPEDKSRSYVPDNTRIQWKKKKSGIVLSQPTENWTNMKKEIEIKMESGEAKVTIVHRITNEGSWAIELAAWALTVLSSGGTEIIPQVTKDTGLLPNRMISLWPYSKMDDSRVLWGSRYILLKQDSSKNTPFKIGIPNEDGWAAYANNGHLFVKRFKHQIGVAYPDYASSFETYTCDFMTEIESLSPLMRLEPGCFIEHTETWQLYDNVKKPVTEEDVDKYIIPVIK